jgi:hypothetical protein
VVATSRDEGRSRVDRQANGCTPTPGEAENDGMEVATRSPQGTLDRQEGVFLAPAMVGVATSLTAGGSRTRMRSDDEESATPPMSHTSLVSTVIKGKKRRLISLTPDISEELEMEVRMSSAADVSAEVTRQIAEIIRVAKTFSNLKGIYVKAIKDAAGYISIAWQNQMLQSVGLGQNSGTAAAKLADARMIALEKENAALRQELSRRTACVHECPRCRGSASESDRPPREGKSKNARFADLERRVEEIRPSILRAIVERFGGHLLNNPETRQRMTEQSATSRFATAAEKPPTPSPRKQQEEKWKAVASKRVRRKEAKERMATDVRETAKKWGRTAALTPPARRQPTQQPQKRTTGLPKPSSGAAAMKTGPSPASRMVTLPRIQRTSAVTLTLREGANNSHGETEHPPQGDRR